MPQELRPETCALIGRTSTWPLLGALGGLMMQPPDGFWGMPAEMLKTLPEYDPDVAKSRAEARRLMEKAGDGPGKQLQIKVAARNLPEFRDTPLEGSGFEPSVPLPKLSSIRAVRAEIIGRSRNVFR
jgi:hypothetical protein